MKSNKHFKFKEQDEYYTPKLLIEPILQYIKPQSTIWCPFDTDTSEYVLLLKEHGHNVIYSHIKYEQDFLIYNPPVDYDYIISNPPFSIKLKVLDKCYRLNKPFALLLGLPILNYQEVGNFFIGKDLQLFIFDKKVSFNGKTSSFNNSYFCTKFLPKDIIFHHLEHNNTNKNFVKSRMIL